MAYLNSNFVNFFKNLAANNHRDWFNANKKIFESEVKKPFEKVVSEVIEKVKKIDPKLDINVKDAVFRIYRDIRFSKDKTPYKLHMAAVVSRGGRKNHQTPGVYFHLGAGECFVGSGSYWPSKENLMKIRHALADNPEKVKKLLNEKAFLKYYPDGLIGEKNKVLPKEFKEAAQKQPLIYNKQFYYMAKYDNKIVEREDLVDFIVEHYKAAKNWNNFLSDAIG